jgi:hypothetical protein
VQYREDIESSKLCCLVDSISASYARGHDFKSVPGSRLSWLRFVRHFSQSVQTNAETIPQLNSRPLSSLSYPVHFSSITPTFDAIQCELLTILLNKSYICVHRYRYIYIYNFSSFKSTITVLLNLHLCLESGNCTILFYIRFQFYVTKNYVDYRGVLSRGSIVS